MDYLGGTSPIQNHDRTHFVCRLYSYGSIADPKRRNSLLIP